MAEETEFAMGATASCSDGVCGEVRRIIVDPATRVVTHLVVEPEHGHEPGRLVPHDQVDTTTGQIRLRCTRAEFGQLDPAEEDQLVENSGNPTGVGGMRTPMGISHNVRVVRDDAVPFGETEVARGEHVHALDGEIGQVEAFLVDPDDHRVTHVLLQEGHLWGRKEVTIPMSAVTGVVNGIWLSMTKKQVEDLPSAH